MRDIVKSTLANIDRKGFIGLVSPQHWDSSYRFEPGTTASIIAEIHAEREELEILRQRPEGEGD